MQLKHQHTETEPPTAPDEMKININHMWLHLQTHISNVLMWRLGLFFVLNVWHLNAIVPTQLLSIQSWAVDSVECQFHSSWEERGRFREELIVLRFHCDGFDEHGITGVFVRFQVWLKIKKKWSEAVLYE